MKKRRSLNVSVSVLRALLIAIVFTGGCDKSEQITTYSVPKHQSLQSAAYLEQYDREHPKPVPRRMIGVIIPQESMTWFLKVDGPVEILAARENAIREFLKSLRFPNPETLEWTLPTGWTNLPASSMRYATIVLDGQPPLEMSVTKLPTQTDLELNQQLLGNINRWRGQLSLSPITESEVADQTEKLTLNSLAMYWVNFVGTQVPKITPMTPPQAPPSRSRSKEEPSAASPRFEKPAEWSEGSATAFAKVSLLATEGDAKVAITVTQAGGNRLVNVNRWRGQLKLDPLSEDQFATAGKPVAIGKISGELYDMTNGERTILGVIVEDRGQMWFVKLDGNSQLAERERPRFEAFLNSLKLD